MRFACSEVGRPAGSGLPASDPPSLRPDLAFPWLDLCLGYGEGNIYTRASDVFVGVQKKQGTAAVALCVVASAWDLICRHALWFQCCYRVVVVLRARRGWWPASLVVGGGGGGGGAALRRGRAPPGCPPSLLEVITGLSVARAWRHAGKKRWRRCPQASIAGEGGVVWWASGG